MCQNATAHPEMRVTPSLNYCWKVTWNFTSQIPCPILQNTYFSTKMTENKKLINWQEKSLTIRQSKFEIILKWHIKHPTWHRTTNNHKNHKKTPQQTPFLDFKSNRSQFLLYLPDASLLSHTRSSSTAWRTPARSILLMTSLVVLKQGYIPAASIHVKQFFKQDMLK